MNIDLKVAKKRLRQGRPVYCFVRWAGYQRVIYIGSKFAKSLALEFQFSIGDVDFFFDGNA